MAKVKLSNKKGKAAIKPAQLDDFSVGDELVVKVGEQYFIGKVHQGISKYISVEYKRNFIVSASDKNVCVYRIVRYN